MNIQTVAVVLTITGSAAICSGTAGADPDLPLQINETAAAIVVSHGDHMVLTYNKQSPPVPDDVDPVYERSGFLHPIASPAGHIVTELFPKDHLHQDGLFSAWVNTSWNDRRIDFWNLAGGTGRVLHQRVVSTFSDADAAGFEVDLVHRVIQTPVADVLRERWKVAVYPSDGMHHCFDLETTQTVLTPVPVVVNQYRYGGIALRGPSRWLQPGAGRAAATAEPSVASDFLTDRGSDRVQGNHEKARWVSLTGQMEQQSVTISVLCHAQNFRAPQAARLHPTKPYFCFAPCVEGDFVIDQQHPYHARYRILVTDAAPDQPWLEQQWQDWCGDADAAR